MASKILVVDDERDIVDLMAYNLEKEGYRVIKAYDGEEALCSLAVQELDLMILDLMLPGIQGMEVARLVRKNPKTSFLPIIMVTARGEEIDKVLGLEVGADDYITKPFSVRELIARIRSVLRRCDVAAAVQGAENFSFRNLVIDYRSYTVTLGGRKVDLSPTEFKLLKFLSQHPGRVYTRNMLLDGIWGDEAFVEPRTVDVHVRRLRARIEEDITNPQFIVTIRGVGYKFADPDA